MIAMTVTLFDCEILGEGKDVEEDSSLRFFGSGVPYPRNKIPMRIRRREVNIA